MQISALLLTIAAAAAAAVTNAQAPTHPDWASHDTNAFGGAVTTDLTKCDEILSTTSYVAPEVFSAETCLQKFDCYDFTYGYKSMREGHWNYREIPASVSQAVSDCDHCLAIAYQGCSDTAFSMKEMSATDKECVEKSFKECKPNEAFTWPVPAPVEDKAGHITDMSTEEGTNVYYNHVRAV